MRWLPSVALFIVAFTLILANVQRARRFRDGLAPLVPLLDVGSMGNERTHLGGQAWIIGRHNGRLVLFGGIQAKGAWGPAWTIALDLECHSSSFFDLGAQDGPESYATQLPDAGLRNAVRQLIRDYKLHSVQLNATVQRLRSPYRLRVTLDLAANRPDLSASRIGSVLAGADMIARSLEGRSAASHSSA